MSIEIVPEGEKMALGTIMKKHSKTSYHHAGVSIEIVPEGEKIKVRIKDPDEE